MLDRTIRRFAPMFAAAMRAHRYEKTAEGLYFPEARGFAVGEYFYDTNGKNPGSSENLITTQGFNYMLDVALRNQAAAPAFFLSIFSGTYTPLDAVTAATYPAAATEIVSNTTGYNETTRRPWTPVGAAAGGILTNNDGTTDNKAAFTIKVAAAGATLTIRGAALHSEAAKGSTGGTLVSVSRFRPTGCTTTTTCSTWATACACAPSKPAMAERDPFSAPGTTYSGEADALPLLPEARRRMYVAKLIADTAGVPVWRSIHRNAETGDVITTNIAGPIERVHVAMAPRPPQGAG